MITFLINHRKEASIAGNDGSQVRICTSLRLTYSN